MGVVAQCRWKRTYSSSIEFPPEGHEMSPNRAAGFTLAELLVSLAILGVLATFSVPKILAAQQNGQKTAVFREDIAFLQAGLYTYIQQGNMQLNSHACGTPTPTDVTAIIQSITNYRKKSGKTFYYVNGSSITAFSGDAMDLVIDWNGDDGANTSGDDQIHYYFNDCSGTWAGIPSGRFGAASGDIDDTLYQQIMSQ